MAVPLGVEQFNPPTPPGIPTTNQNQPVVDRPSGNSNGNSSPQPKFMYEVKEKLMRPALTSHFQCWFDPPNDVRNFIKNNRQFNYDGPGNPELISLSCSEASLPGSSLVTNEINDDFTGVTERLAYRRQYDDRIDFTFYVDYGRDDGSYNVLWFFENWIQYIANEQYSGGMEDGNYNYRFRFPDGIGDAKGSSGYRTTLYINKFERDFKAQYLRYRFVKAYPISIDSMPVSYDSSELLKCTVSFTYLRYVVDRKLREPSGRSPSSPIPEPGQVSPTGIPDPEIFGTNIYEPRTVPSVTDDRFA
jgi:hypothetical protein